MQHSQYVCHVFKVQTLHWQPQAGSAGNKPHKHKQTCNCHFTCKCASPAKQAADRLPLHKPYLLVLFQARPPAVVQLSSANQALQRNRCDATAKLQHRLRRQYSDANSQLRLKVEGAALHVLCTSVFVHRQQSGPCNAQAQVSNTTATDPAAGSAANIAGGCPN